jgi:hypothetical protein
MIQLKLSPVGLRVLLCGGLLVLSLPAAEPVPPTEDAHPFTHLAYIPANSELGTIRFEGIKRVNVPARIKHIADGHYCAELAFSDPGGSMFCPSTRTGSVTAAYEVTYSFTGQPMASDELASRRFALAVYFRPDELAPEVLHAVRTDMAGYFAVNTYREPVRRVVIDSARSSLCPGSYRDGVWTHNDESCQDDIHYTAITTPSDSVTVRVDAVPISAQRPPSLLPSTKRLGDSR